jgi:hypothetical protein
MNIFICIALIFSGFTAGVLVAWLVHLGIYKDDWMESDGK